MRVSLWGISAVERVHCVRQVHGSSFVRFVALLFPINIITSWIWRWFSRFHDLLKIMPIPPNCDSWRLRGGVKKHVTLLYSSSKKNKNKQINKQDKLRISARDLEGRMFMHPWLYFVCGTKNIFENLGQVVVICVSRIMHQSETNTTGQYTYTHNIEDSHHKNFRGKAISIKFSKCVCSVRYPVCNAHASYYAVMCGLSGSPIFFHIIL